MVHAKVIIQPAQDYYKNLFHKEGEHCYDMRKIDSAAIIFNPKHLKGGSEAETFTVIHYKVNKFLHFNYYSFTPEFIF